MMIKQGKRKGLGGWIFLALVLAAYAILALLDPQKATDSLAFFMQVMKQLLPALGLVFVLLFVVNLLLGAVDIRPYLGQGAGLKGWLMAVVGGMLSIGPVYAWYAVLSELQLKGMRTALTATFLYSRAVKLPMLPLMMHYFGLAYTLVLSLYLIVFAVINGLLLEKLLSRQT